MKKIFYFLFIYFIFTLSNLAHATLWPVFTAPDEMFLRAKSVLTSDGCSQNQGKLLSNISFPVAELCGTYCPHNWYWKGVSDNQCHEFNRDFELLGFSIQHYSDQNGTTRYSEIEARYGNKVTNQVYARFVFTTPEEHWFCIEKNPSIHTLTCANDI